MRHAPQPQLVVLRTPDECFVHLPEFPFAPHYVAVNGLRVHYHDEGQGEVVLCLYGEPSWSYLYRKMIPILSATQRVVAMDFIGFGRSDKFIDACDYSFKLHHDTLIGFIEQYEKMMQEKRHRSKQAPVGGRNAKDLLVRARR